HLFFMVPYIYLARERGTPWRNTIFILGCLLFARSFLMGERLAFLEFALPLIVVLSMLTIIRVTWTRLLLLAVGLPILFIVTEMFRSFYGKFVSEIGWAHVHWTFLLSWNLERFFVYYIDTLNKFYVAISGEFFYATSYWAEGLSRILDRLEGL